MKPLVSIIVPNYNHRHYLSQRLKSISEQSFQNFEIILLDDASTDGSAEILKEFSAKDPRARFEPSSQNSGSPFVQWNKGAALAQGKYLWIAESDDSAHPELLETLVERLEENPRVGIAYAQSLLVDERGETLNSYAENLQFIYKSRAWEKDFVVQGQQACRDWVVYHNPIPNASGILMRKQAYQQAGGADVHMRLNGDWHLYAKILVDWDLAFCARELNYFRVHPQTQRSLSRKRASVYQELVSINKLIRESVPDSTAAADRALGKIADWWIGNLPYHSFTAENRQINRQLYRFFARHKNHLAWRIALTYGISYLRDFLRFTGLLKPLKKWRSALFPGKYWEQ